ncbi:MAG: 2-oxoisovalerate dehydrogenase [Acidobacteria bacterium]|nr:2-oxoisovalerate dehydrogenase [Acidobacteriota bacterium]
MNEIIFLVEDAVEGGFTAKALGESIFTEGDTIDEIRANIREAVDCHFEPENKPKVIRLHFVSEEVLAA